MNEDISQKKVIFVVSHCNKPLHWMQDFILNGLFVVTRIYIFSKCGEQPVGAPEGAVVQVLSNVGREGHTYAHFITEILPKEVGVGVAKQRESIVVFLQDDIGYNHLNACTLPHGCLLDLEELVRLASSSNGFGCWSSPPNIEYVFRRRGEDASAYHNTVMLSQFEARAYKNTYRNDNIMFKSSHANIGEYWLTINLTLSQQVIPVCYGGIFAASVENIYKQDMNMYKKIRESLTRGDNIEEGHFVERSWASILSNPLKPLQIEAIQNYSTDIGGRPFNGILMHNME
jgi:hypothetical protein